MPATAGENVLIGAGGVDDVGGVGSGDEKRFWRALCWEMVIQ